MRFAWIFVLILIAYWCSENKNLISADDSNSSVSFKQIPGCQENNGLPKASGINKTCFDYTFNEVLELTFCIPANCCPDSNRFDYNYQISSDTIYFTVLDTAKHLCNCICNYKLQTEIFNLNRQTYFFICSYYDSVYYNKIIFKEN